MIRRFRVTIKETTTFTRELSEPELAALLDLDIEGALAGDIEDMWLEDVEYGGKMTTLEEIVRLDPPPPDVSLPEYHLEEL